MNIPSDPSASYIAIILFLIGLFLFISGLNLIKVEKLTVSSGFKTWIIGLVLMLASIFIGTPKLVKMDNIFYKENVNNVMENYIVEIYYFPTREKSAENLGMEIEKVGFLVLINPADKGTLERKTGTNNSLIYDANNFKELKGVKILKKLSEKLSEKVLMEKFIIAESAKEGGSPNIITIILTDLNM